MLHKVDICIPVFNGAKTIVRALHSALSQNYGNFVVLVSDNASNDETVPIIKKKFPNELDQKKITLISRRENIGEFQNFQFLIKESKAKYVMILGADDYLSEDCITSLVEPMVAKNNKLSQGNLVRFDATKKDLVKIPKYVDRKKVIHDICSNKKMNYLLSGLWDREIFLKALQSIDRKLSINGSSSDRLIVLSALLSNKIGYSIVDKEVYFKDYCEPNENRLILKKYHAIFYSILNCANMINSHPNIKYFEIFPHWVFFHLASLVKRYIGYTWLRIQMIKWIKFNLDEETYLKLKSFSESFMSDIQKDIILMLGIISLVLTIFLCL